MPEGCAAIQRDCDRLEKWADRNLTQSTRDRQCSVLHLRRNNPRHQYLLEATHMESSFAEKDLGVLVHTKLTMSQQCALAAKKEYGILGCLRQSIATKSREVIFPLYSALVRGALCPVLGSSDTDILQKVQQRATKLIKGLERLTRGKAERAGTVQPGEEKSRGESHQCI